jgi:hypothetical protein
MPSRDGAPPAKPAGSPRAERRVRIRIWNPFLPASMTSVPSVVKSELPEVPREWTGEAVPGVCLQSHGRNSDGRANRSGDSPIRRGCQRQP